MHTGYHPVPVPMSEPLFATNAPFIGLRWLMGGPTSETVWMQMLEYLAAHGKDFYIKNVAKSMTEHAIGSSFSPEMVSCVFYYLTRPDVPGLGSSLVRPGEPVSGRAIYLDLLQNWIYESIGARVTPVPTASHRFVTDRAADIRAALEHTEGVAELVCARLAEHLPSHWSRPLIDLVRAFRLEDTPLWQRVSALSGPPQSSAPEPAPYHLDYVLTRTYATASLEPIRAPAPVSAPTPASEPTPPVPEPTPLVPEAPAPVSEPGQEAALLLGVSEAAPARKSKARRPRSAPVLVPGPYERPKRETRKPSRLLD